MDMTQLKFTVEVLPPLPPDCGSVALSPDGSRLACVRPVPDTGSVGVWTSPVRTVDLQPMRVQQEFQAISLLEWSPDGKCVAFASCEGLPPGANHRLWVADVDGSVAPRLIYNGQGSVVAVSWSPNGALLAVADGDAGVIVCTVDGKHVTTVNSEAMRYPLGPNCMTWVGSDLLAYVSLSQDTSGVWLTDLEADESRRVLSLDAGEVAIPAWTGGQIWGALRGRLKWPAEELTLYVWRNTQADPAAYSLPQVVFDPATVLVPSGDGHLWAFTAWEDGQRGLWVVSLPSGEAQKLELKEPVGELVGWVEDPCRLLVSVLPVSPGIPDEEIEGLEEGRGVSLSGETFTLNFAPAELALVARLLDAPSLQLSENPFRGWPVEEIEDAMAQAQESLADRRYLQVQPDGTIALDVSVAAMVGALAFPDSSLIATMVVGEEPPGTRQVHFASGLIVEQAQQDDTYCLTAVRNRGMVSRRLEEFLNLADQPVLSVQPCTLAETEVDEAREVATDEGEEACAELLERAGAPSVTARSLAKALTHPVSQSALLALGWEAGEAQRMDSFTLLEGMHGLWLFRPLQRDDESLVEVTPCDASYVMLQVEELTHLVILKEG